MLVAKNSEKGVFLAPLVASWKSGLELIWAFQTVSEGEFREVHMQHPA